MFIKICIAQRSFECSPVERLYESANVRLDATLGDLVLVVAEKMDRIAQVALWTTVDPDPEFR